MSRSRCSRKPSRPPRDAQASSRAALRRARVKSGCRGAGTAEIARSEWYLHGQLPLRRCAQTSTKGSPGVHPPAASVRLAIQGESLTPRVGRKKITARPRRAAAPGLPVKGQFTVNRFQITRLPDVQSKDRFMIEPKKVSTGSRAAAGWPEGVRGRTCVRQIR